MLLKNVNTNIAARLCKVFLPYMELPHWGSAASIERYMEAQAFLRSYDSAPRPPPPSPSHVSMLDRPHTGRLGKRDNLLTGEGRGGGRGAESYDRKKA
jgi:hypothetical protein